MKITFFWFIYILNILLLPSLFNPAYATRTSRLLFAQGLANHNEH